VEETVRFCAHLGDGAPKDHLPLTSFSGRVLAMVRNASCNCVFIAAAVWLPGMMKWTPPVMSATCCIKAVSASTPRLMVRILILLAFAKLVCQLRARKSLLRRFDHASASTEHVRATPHVNVLRPVVRGRDGVRGLGMGHPRDAPREKDGTDGESFHRSIH